MMKLGKNPACHDKRTLKYAKYRTEYRIAVPAKAHWGHGLPYDMLGNDQYGDCVEAAYGHMLQVWIDRAGGSFTPDSTSVLNAYSALTGFTPANPNTDRGTDMLAAAKYWRSTGMNGHEIDAFLEVDPRATDQVKEAVFYYGGLNIGLQLPLSAQDQSSPEGTWAVSTGSGSTAGSWGGHCVPICGFGPDMIWVVTWGYIQAMTWEFFQTYCDEAFVFLSHDWIEGTGKSPSGLAWGQLMADLSNLG